MYSKQDYFLTFSFPLADLRPLIAGETFEIPTLTNGKLLTERLVNEAAPQPFMKFFGKLRARTEAFEDAQFGSENFFFEADRAFLFPPLQHVYDATGNFCTLNLNCLRRLYATGWMVNRLEVNFLFDIGIAQSMAEEVEYDLERSDYLGSIVENLSRLPIRIPRTDLDPELQPLVKIAPGMARRYLEGTTYSAQREQVRSFWVQGGRPLAFLSFKGEASELRFLNGDAHYVDTFADKGIHLFQGVLETYRQEVKVWLAQLDEEYDKEALRRIRVTLIRMHANREAVRLALEATYRQQTPLLPDTASSKHLECLLEKSLTYLMPEAEEQSVYRKNLFPALFELEQELEPQAITHLFEQIQHFPREVRKRLERYFEQLRQQGHLWSKEEEEARNETLRHCRELMRKGAFEGVINLLYFFNGLQETEGTLLVLNNRLQRLRKDRRQNHITREAFDTELSRFETELFQFISSFTPNRPFTFIAAWINRQAGTPPPEPEHWQQPCE